MKILLLTNQDLASLIALNLLMPKLTNHQVMLGMSDKVGGNHQQPQALVELAQFEQGLIQRVSQFSQSWSKDLIQTIKANHIDSFDEIGQKYQIKINPLNDINQPNGILRVKKFNPDLILSIRFGKILQQPVIDIPAFGVINLHSGLLPDYQGVMATFWAMLNDEMSIGTCLHFISDKNIDSGAIIQQSNIPIDKSKSYLHNVLKLYEGGCNMMIAAVKKLENNQIIESYPQQGKATYYGFPTEKDLQQFVAMGYRLFDVEAY
jgi:methionyl-tRNA formyltransferase